MAADTRTNAGVDNIGRFKKLHTWAKPGERVFVLLTAGNLACTQAVVSTLSEGVLMGKRKGASPNLFSVDTMFQAARLVGKAARAVRRVDDDEIGASGESFWASFLFAGQIGKERPRLFQVYGAGNFIEATDDTPFFQVGEHKYGKPILDRVAQPAMRLGQAAKLLLLSFDSTVRSNLSVGLPIDLLAYQRDSLVLDHMKRIGADDPYFRRLSAEWGQALRAAFAKIEEFDI